MEKSNTIAVKIAGDDETQVVVYKHPGVKAYQCRIKFQGQPWKSQTTRHENLDTATEAAKNIYYQMKGKLEAGGQIHVTRFKDLAKNYLLERQREIDRSTHKRGAASMKEYRATINTYLIPFFGDMDVMRINREAILEYREWRHTYWTDGPGAKVKSIEYERGGRTVKRPVTDRSGPSERRIQIEDTVLKAVFNYGMELEKVTKLPPLKTPKAQRNSRPAIEAKHLEDMLGRIYNRTLDAPNEHIAYQRRVFEVFFKLCLLSGVRPGKETASLQWKHFIKDDDKAEFYLRPENAKKRLSDKKRRNVVPMKELLGLLGVWRMQSRFNGDDDYILAGVDGKPLTRYSKQFQSLMKEVGHFANRDGEKYEPYCLRHTYATMALRKGIKPHIIAHNLGHSNTKMIELHYGHDSVADYYDDLSNVVIADQTYEDIKRK